MNLPKTNNKDITKYSQPYFYKYTRFGNSISGLHSFSIELTVSQLETDFVIFQEIKEIEHWPVSQLIQRELDTTRSNQIAKSYLLENKDRLKMFPPLTVAFIPVNSDGKPIGKYGDGVIDNNLVDTIKSRFDIQEGFEWNQEKSMDGLLNFIVKDNEQFGNLVWDKTKIHAVVIDGQHRMKALLKASIEDKEITNWYLSINIIDLREFIETKQSSVETKEVVYYVRDIFMDMNNTSVAVDLSKRILINNNNPICLITQDLVEEGEFNWSSENYKEYPFIPPQLIDWDCVGGKHESKKMTGIITLSQVIEFAFFDSKDIDKIKNTKRNIKNWRDLVESVFQIEYLLKREGKPSFKEYIETYYSEIIDDDLDESDESSEILFQYDNIINLMIRDQFINLYKDSLLLVYSTMKPYSYNYETGKEFNIFNSKDNIFRFSRMTNKKLKNLEDLDNEEKFSKSKLINNYYPKVKDLNEKYFILTSVMGQKALMRFIFKHFMFPNEERKNNNEILESVETFISRFNLFFEFINSNEKYNSFFSLDHVQNSRGELLIDQNFWEGIISKNKNIIYNKSGMDTLIYIIEYIFKITNEKENKSVIKRIESILKGLYGNTYDNLNEHSIKINKSKIDYLIKIRKEFESFINK